MNELHMAHTGFKAYDIRGVIPDEINEELAYRVGRAYAELYHPKTMCVGYDVRKSSPRLSAMDLPMEGFMFTISASAERKWYISPRSTISWMAGL